MSDKDFVNIRSEGDDSPVLSNNDDDSYIISYYKKNINNEKELVKIVKAVEKMVRGSSEYKQFISYLKKDVKLTSCAVFPNVDSDLDDVIVEMHHYPFNLYDICETVIINSIVMNLDFSTFTISSEVIGLHFNGLIGIVPLSKTVHELVHAEHITLTMDMVYGDISIFIELYTGSFSKKVIKKINKIISENKEFDASILTS